MINEVWQGDCLKLMQDIPDQTIDLIACDLPYGTTVCKWDTIIPFAPLWIEYERIIKPNGIIALTAAQPFTSSLIMSNVNLFKYELIWHKAHPKGHLNAKKQPMRAHENILIFYKKPGIYNPQMTSGHKRKVAKTSYTKEHTGDSVYGKEVRNTEYDSTERYPLSVQVFSNADLTNVLHPTQKPVPLWEYLIKTYTNPGALVLDNCAGSGTTAIACLNTDRRYLCIEQEEKYAEIINNRINGWYIENL